MDYELLATVTTASLLGSLHCVGMCGGFVAFYSSGAGATGVKSVVPHVAYHAGRLVTYTLWGMLAGSLGAMLDVAGHAVGIGRVAAIVAGVLMVTWGLAMLTARLGVSLPWLRTRRSVSWLSRALARLVDKPPIVRASLLGLSSTLLPCGFLYAFVITAAGTGSALRGALVMAAFWFGTVPLLLGLGLGVERIGARLRRFVPTVTALLMVALGAYAVVGRVNVAASAARGLEAGLFGLKASNSSGTKSPVAPPMPSDCPCHRH
ncbi:MAG TPA: sulfite exporter TauE/SafE family protein [Polyangiaceae bacterium]